jgi:hypothetical protein
VKWFRFYSEVLHDSKVQTLKPEMFRAWVNLLCLANEGTERGRLPELKQVAFALRLSEEKAAQVIGQLTACGLIDADEAGGNRPHNWDRRQRDSDDVNSRVREHRKRKARVAKPADVTLQETLQETSKNQDVTVRGEERRGDKSYIHTPRAGAGASANGPDAEPFEAPCSPVAVPDDPCALTDAERAEVESARAKADRLFPMAELGSMLVREPRPLDGMDVSWWSPALDRLAARPKGQRRWDYLLGILRGFHSEGGPPVPGPVNGHSGASRAAERRRLQDEAIDRAVAELPDPEDL